MDSKAEYLALSKHTFDAVKQYGLTILHLLSYTEQLLLSCEMTHVNGSEQTL